ncbi:Catalase-related peroxidase [Oligella ureolytica]
MPAGRSRLCVGQQCPQCGQIISCPIPEAADALQQELFARLNQGPVVFDLVFSLATAADNPDDATVSWPQTNPQLVAGQLHIKQAAAQSDGECNAINFDPLLPSGIKPSADPILRARGAAYAESHRRRGRAKY